MNIKGESFKYASIGKCKSESNPILLFRFKDSFNQTYIVELFEFDYSVYAIKFYPKQYSNSGRRYNLTNSPRFLKDRGTLGAKNFFTILNTILYICLEKLKENPMASFGFLGAPKKSELDKKTNKKNINPDGTIANTKRYRVYLLFILRYFPPTNFKYIQSKSASIFLLRNNKNKQALSFETAVNYINSEIIPGLG